jgi:hypothetical protein
VKGILLLQNNQFLQLQLFFIVKSIGITKPIKNKDFSYEQIYFVKLQKIGKTTSTQL